MLTAFAGSMTARIFLTLVLGTILSGALVMSLATHERNRLDAQSRMRHAAERVEQLVLILDVVPQSLRSAVIRVAQRYGVHIVPGGARPVLGMVSDSAFAAELHRTLGENRRVRVYDGTGKDCTLTVPGRGMTHPGAYRCEAIVAGLRDGSNVTLDITYRDRATPLLENYPAELLVLVVALTLLALFVSHMATQPLRRLARAAHALGRNIERPSLPETEGSTEVRAAAAAFNTMQARIRSHLQERTCMLAAVAHDLQTPLTRLRLRLEKVGDPELHARLVNDLTATQNMVTSGLEFARLPSVDEPFERVDLDSLVAAICSDAMDAGCDIACSGRLGQPVLAAPHALRRCISNLVDNALKYGKLARVRVYRSGHTAVVEVADAGPGIPESRREEMFQPFRRNAGTDEPDSPGTGLGLAIARIVAQQHKAALRLHGGPDGRGLVAILELPLP